MSQPPSSGDLIALFNGLFIPSDRTELVGGASEPLYRPATEPGGLNAIHFTHDYCASALHEVAHWCIAGKRRRQQLDYGYWYVPDGRNLAQQRSFELVEVKPQALEWVFSRAMGLRFRLSADNLDGSRMISAEFKDRVWRQARVFCTEGLNSRAQRFAARLAQYYQQPDFLEARRYCRETL